MQYDYEKLKRRIALRYDSQAAFAEALGMREEALCHHLKGEIPWQQVEIDRACTLLKIPYGEIPIYFFTVEVQND